MVSELAMNEYYFAVHPAGYILKTKSVTEFDRYLKWSVQFLFSGIVKNNEHLHYKVGQTWFQKAISKIYTSKDLSEDWLVDDTEILTNHHSNITKVKIGGRERPETYETL